MFSLETSLENLLLFNLFYRYNRREISVCIRIDPGCRINYGFKSNRNREYKQCDRNLKQIIIYGLCITGINRIR